MQGMRNTIIGGRTTGASLGRRAYLALGLAVFFWSGNFVAGRALRGEIDPVMLNTLRWTICLLLFLPFVLRPLREKKGVVLREWRLVAGLGITGVATFHTLVYIALRDTTAINALLILALAPAAILTGAALTGIGRPRPLQWLGSLVSLGGAGFIVTRGDPAILAELEVNRGDLWMLAAVMFWAAYSLLLKRRPSDLPQDVTLAASVVAALLVLVPAAALSTASLPFHLAPPAWAAVLYIAIFASLVAFLLWSFGVSEIGPERAGQFIHLMPVFGAGLAMLILGESVRPVQAVGAAFVFAGILLVNKGAAR